MDLYLRFSKLAHSIYKDYSDKIEPFGIDESWIDITSSVSALGDGPHIADKISKRIKHELGLTVSIGISYNKIFAKFGSDYKKPDAITHITRDNYKDIVWRSPVGDLLYVGRATERKLRSVGIRTIGDLATASPDYLKGMLGKMGLILWIFANGEDQTPVSEDKEVSPIKSIGNSTTTPRDLTCDDDVSTVLYLLSESVASRLRDNHFVGRNVGISVRDNGLFWFSRQKKIDIPTNISEEIYRYALEIFKANYTWRQPIRSIGVRVSDLILDEYCYQLSLFSDPIMREKQLKADIAVDTVKNTVVGQIKHSDGKIYVHILPLVQSGVIGGAVLIQPVQIHLKHDGIVGNDLSVVIDQIALVVDRAGLCRFFIGAVTAVVAVITFTVLAAVVSLNVFGGFIKARDNNVVLTLRHLL